MFHDYSERGGKITVTSYNIDNEQKEYLVSLGKNKWLVQIEYNITRYKDYLYNNGRENIIGDKHTSSYDPVFIIEKQNDEYYINSMSMLDLVFSEYHGR